MNGWTIVKLCLAYEAGMTIREGIERHRYYNQARQYADEIGKPLLVVGMRRNFTQPPNGDVTVDIDPAVQTIEGGVWASECKMPFYDKQFGACYNAHTLEHLAAAEEIEVAVNECLRVSDVAIFLAPSPYSILATFFCPSHNTRLWFDQVNNRVRVADNKFRTGLGIPSGDTRHPPPNTFGQALVVTEPPKIVRIGNAYLASSYGLEMV